jgi:hypothetical protein
MLAPNFETANKVMKVCNLKPFMSEADWQAQRIGGEFTHLNYLESVGQEFVTDIVSLNDLPLRPEEKRIVFASLVDESDRIAETIQSVDAAHHLLPNSDHEAAIKQAILRDPDARFTNEAYALQVQNAFFRELQLMILRNISTQSNLDDEHILLLDNTVDDFLDHMLRHHDIFEPILELLKDINSTADYQRLQPTIMALIDQAASEM